jgi:hypothetical protein
MDVNETTLDRLYALVANEEDARACTDIGDDACRVVPGNFFLMLCSLVLTKIGDLLVSPKIVLSWLLGSVGASPFLIAWLVPIRESGSLIPQLAIGAWVRRHPRRAGFWVLGSALQGACAAGMALAVWQLDGLAAGLAVLGLLILFSLSRGFCSVSMKDVQGKCVPKARRGRLAGLATTFSGLATLAVSLLLIADENNPSRSFYLTLLLVGAGLWWSAAILFRFVREFDGETAGGANALREAWQSLKLLRDDAPFRHFVITRSLLLCSALSAPFFVVLAQESTPNSKMLGAFLLATSLASTLSAAVWGWMADASSRDVMIRGSGIAATTCLAVGAGTLCFPGWFLMPWVLPVAYLLLSIAHAGVRIGRKTYLVDMAGGTKRTDYVAVSNTVIGVLLLVTGGVSALASLLSVEAVLILLGLMGAAGTISALRLQAV